MPFRGVLPYFSSTEAEDPASTGGPATQEPVPSVPVPVLPRAPSPMVGEVDPLPFASLKDVPMGSSVGMCFCSFAVSQHLTFFDQDLSPEDVGLIAKELVHDSPPSDTHDIISLHDSGEDGDAVAESQSQPDEESEEEDEVTPPRPVKIKVEPLPPVASSSRTLPTRGRGQVPVVELTRLRTAPHIRVEGRLPIPSATILSPRAPRSDKKSKGKKRQASPPSVSSGPSVRTRATTLAQLKGQVPHVLPGDLGLVARAIPLIDTVSHTSRFFLL